MTLPSVIQCAGHCKLNKECSGFTYNETNGDCVMSCCVNPQQLEEAAGVDNDVIYAETTPNYLLARGDPFLLLIVFWLLLYFYLRLPSFSALQRNDRKQMAN